MESNLVAEFIHQTGCNTETAYSFLQTKNWDLQQALQSWAYLSMLPPEQNVSDFEISNDYLSSSPDAAIAIGRAARGSLQKVTAVDLVDVKKLSRGISRATENVNLVSRARKEFALDFKENPCFKVDGYFIETPEYTFTLPDVTVYDEDFRDFLEKDLIEKSTLVALEQAGRLNWWANYGLCQRLWPLSTTGDGNCLLHAASLGMWGFHDRLLTLRKALYLFLKESESQSSLYRRWRWQQTRINAQSGFVYSESEWRVEWENIINMASTKPREIQSDNKISTCFTEQETEVGATYESLEEIHVLALAHVLRRPIIVIADLMLKDMNGDAIAPIPFGGIYLPFEVPVPKCHRSPLLLTYDMAHFSALVVMENSFGDRTSSPPAVIPLVDIEGCILPIQFSVDPGEYFEWDRDQKDQHIVNKLILIEKAKVQLLRDYLDVIEISTVITPIEEDEVDSEDEIDKRFAEINDLSEESSDTTLFGNKSRAAKQLQSVAKQFGSIGKSMSKKLKKNLGTITKITKSSAAHKKQQDVAGNVLNLKGGKLLCAKLNAKRHEYQEEMVKNYLQFAQTRYLREAQLKSENCEAQKSSEQTLLEEPLKCINSDCNNFGTAATSYMCQKCFETQRSKEISQSSKINSPHLSEARYGTGKSKFYANSDVESHNIVKRLPSTKACTNSDQTLYLSKSTFYNDTGSSLVNNTYPYNNLILDEKDRSTNQSLLESCTKQPLDVFEVNSRTRDGAIGSREVDVSNDRCVEKESSPFNLKKSSLMSNSKTNMLQLRNHSGKNKFNDNIRAHLQKNDYENISDNRNKINSANSKTDLVSINDASDENYLNSNYFNNLNPNKTIFSNKKPMTIQDNLKQSYDNEQKKISSSHALGYNEKKNMDFNNVENFKFNNKLHPKIHLGSDAAMCYDMHNVEISNHQPPPYSFMDATNSDMTPELSCGLPQPCRSINCNFFGNVDTGFYCSKCSKQQKFTGTLI